MKPPAIRRLSFIIPVKNDAARLKRCLDAIAANLPSATSIEIVVADNGSTDESGEVASARGARVLRLPSLGVSELRNRAADASTGEVLAFVDADNLIVPSWIAAVLDVMADDRIGAAGALCWAPPDGTWVQAAYDVLRGRTMGRADTTWLGAGNLVVRRVAFEAVRGFDTTLEACEDVDLCQRLRAAGWRLIADERFGSVHLGDPPTLAALFRGERWRGRDNLKVSLRGAMTLRDLPSVIIPILDLAAFIVALWGLATWPFAGRGALYMALGAIALVLGLSALRVLRRLVSRRLSAGAIARTFAVAVTYDVARALAIVWPGAHHRPPGAKKASSGVALT
ncbi:MAG TPA: glycosyltransferase [Vicinamibacterales bacterium]|nr:glycosyltransferase [Vicinamibacterales bacterium]